MKKRNSWLWLMILSSSLFLLSACGEDGFLSVDTPTPQYVFSTRTVVPLPPDASTAAAIRARGHLLVGVRYDDAPFGFVDDQGDLIGFDVDLAREFALRWMGDRDAVRFAQVTNASVNERIETGQVDMVIGALSPNQSAAGVMSFSALYYFDGLSLVVRASDSVTDTTNIGGPSDLSGMVVGVVEDADTEAPLRRAAGGAVPQVVYYPSYYAAMAGLETAVVDAVVGPRRTLERLTAGNDGVGLTPRFTHDPYAIGVPHNDGTFLDLVNVTLVDTFNDGTYQRLARQWLPNGTVPDLVAWSGTSRVSFDGLSDTLARIPDTIGDIEERGYLMVGLVDDQLPFGDFDADGVARGFEAELARVFAGRWLGDIAAVQFVRHSEESGIAALQTDQIDLLAAHVPHTLSRDDEIDFSQTIYQGGLGVLVSAASGFSDFPGLNGGTVAVSNGGGVADAVQRAATEAGITVSIVPVNDVNAALTGVGEGRYHAYADGRSDLLNLAYTNSGFLVLDDRLTFRPIALGLRSNDAAFRDLVNLTLQELAINGRYAALYDGWFGTDPPYAVEVWPGVPYRSLELDRLRVAAPTATP